MQVVESAGTPSAQVAKGARALVWTYAVATVAAVVVWPTGRGGADIGNPVEVLASLLNIPLSRSLASIAILVLTTHALVRRKRAGLMAVAVFQVLGMSLSVAVELDRTLWRPLRPWVQEREILRWADLLAIPVGAAALLWLWRLRPAFRARLRPGSWPGAVGVALFGLTGTFAVAVVLTRFAVPPGRAPFWLSAGSLINRSLRLHLAGVPRYHGPAWPAQVVSLLLVVTMFAVVWTFLRTSRDPSDWSGGNELRIRRLIAASGAEDSLAYFATRRDRSVVFSPDGQAAVSFRVILGVALAAGDPIGSRASWAAAIQQWRARAEQYGWLTGVLAASAAGATAYARTGMNVLPLGDEAVLDVAGWQASGHGLREARRAAQRARRAGIRVDVVRQEALDEPEVTRLNDLAGLWRSSGTERGFSMALNRQGDPADPRVLFVIARDAEQQPVGLLSFVPWGSSGVSLDLMRRSPQAPPGVTELMVWDLMEQAGRIGVRRVSLNFCVFRTVFESAADLGAGPVTRMNNSLLTWLDRFWQLERLYRSNRIYQPQWRPRYLCYDDAVALPQVGLAAAAAEGFVPASGSRRSSARLTLTAAEVAEARQITPQLKPESPRHRPAPPYQQRLRQLRQLRERGLGPAVDACADSVPGPAAALRATGVVTVTGRVNRIRDHGGVVFADLTSRGETCQLLLQPGADGCDVAAFRALVSTGDLLRVEATAGRSRTGTASLLVHRWRVVAKALRPVPFRSAGPRIEQRSLDLIVHPAQAALLRARTQVVRSLREGLDRRGFTEVETPMLHPVHGGALARPFVTHSNAADLELYLRIAPELYLKRLLVGGMGALYEIGRNFRNEGVDATHNPEFTSLEAYQPGGDYTTVRHLAQELVVEAAVRLHGRPVLPPTDADPGDLLAGRVSSGWIDIADPWPVVSVLDAVSAALGRPISLDTGTAELVRLAQQRGVPIGPDAGRGAIIEELYGTLVEATTVRPTFYVDFPKETSPLVAPHRSRPGLCERWDLVVNGLELGTGYSELTDPIDQRARLTEQSLKAAGGDLEAMQLDEDFLRALEVGMPPTGGVGIGVDRLVMLLTNTTIRSVLSFPLAKPAVGRG